MKLRMKTVISKVWIYCLFVVIMMGVIAMKKDYHMDEVFSYGLANNVGQTSIHPLYAPHTYDYPAEVFLDYMLIEEGEGFSISNCWYNQERESSPPLYYFTVHIMSVFAGQRFSRWTAGVINIFYMSLTLWSFREILKLFGIKGKKLTLFSLFFVLSPAILNNVSFFRMYTMAIFFATRMMYLILSYRKRENLRFYLEMIAMAICGVLTQYYLIFYLFFLSLIYGISLLYEKQWKKAGMYILSMGVAGGLTYLIFPGIVKHLTTGRGAEGIENFSQGLEIHWTNLKEYYRILNEQLFGNWFFIFVVVIAIAYMIKKLKFPKETRITDPWMLSYMIVPVVGYVVIVAKVAPYNTDRYVMSIHAIVISLTVLGLNWIVESYIKDKELIRNGLLVCACTTLLVNIWSGFDWKYLYLSSEEHINKIAEYSDVDGLVVLDVGWKISGNFVEMTKLGSLTFFQNEIDALEEMDELKNKEEFVLYAVSCDEEAVIEQIYEICPQINAAEYIGKSDSAQIYHLYHK